MVKFKMHIYLLFYGLLIISGCTCIGTSEIRKTCNTLNDVSKSFTIEVYARYRHNGEPIQNEGKLVVFMDYRIYTFLGESGNNDNRCIYSVSNEETSIDVKFNDEGYAKITTNAFEFQNKYENVLLTALVSFPFSSDIDKYINQNYVKVNYNSKQNHTFYFSYTSNLDL